MFRKCADSRPYRVKADSIGMFKRLSHKPGEFAVAMALEIALRAVSLEVGPDLQQFRNNLEFAVGTTIYSTHAKSLLVQPLRKQKISVDGTDWRACAVNLYALWQGVTPPDVEQRMAGLREDFKDNWRKTFPDDLDIDEQKLRRLYQSSPALLVNGIHDLNDISLALRFFVAEQLAIAANGQGVFDWGGSDGICCLFARHLVPGTYICTSPMPQHAGSENGSLKQSGWTTYIFTTMTPPGRPPDGGSAPASAPKCSSM